MHNPCVRGHRAPARIAATPMHRAGRRAGSECSPVSICPKGFCRRTCRSALGGLTRIGPGGWLQAHPQTLCLHCQDLSMILFLRLVGRASNKWLAQCPCMHYLQIVSRRPAWRIPTQQMAFQPSPRRHAHGELARDAGLAGRGSELSRPSFDGLWLRDVAPFAQRRAVAGLGSYSGLDVVAYRGG